MENLALEAISIKPSTITLPGSKSISNRCLLLSALSDNTSTLDNVLDSDDTVHMLNALSTLGVKWQNTAKGQIQIEGVNGQFPITQADLFLGNAGTAFRPLTAVLSILGGCYQLSGVDRMHERPIADLVDALRLAGADCQYLQTEGYPPLKIGPFKDNGVRRLSIQGNVSSQFLTALLMALPLTKQAYQIAVIGDLISKPYIDITLSLLQRFGLNITHQNYQLFNIPADCHYHAPESLYIEGDASSASYFLAAGLLTGKTITVEGIGQDSIQGDVAFADILSQLGAQVDYGSHSISISRDITTPIPAFDIDANHIPDAAMTLAIIALAAKGSSHIRNIASWRVKETDRIKAMHTELEKLGATVMQTDDSISITPPEKLNSYIAIDTYDDHRMAMCFALVSLLDTPIIINDPKCVNKTFPNFFEDFLSMKD